MSSWGRKGWSAQRQGLTKSWHVHNSNSQTCMCREAKMKGTFATLPKKVGYIPAHEVHVIRCSCTPVRNSLTGPDSKEKWGRGSEVLYHGIFRENKSGFWIGHKKIFKKNQHSKKTPRLLNHQRPVRPECCTTGLKTPKLCQNWFDLFANSWASRVPQEVKCIIFKGVPSPSSKNGTIGRLYGKIIPLLISKFRAIAHLICFINKWRS